MPLSFGAIAGLLGLGAGGSFMQSALNYAFSAASQKRQYEYQRQLNQQGYDLTQQGYREQYGNLRQGLESAGYNPMLALNPSGLGSYSGGSAASANPQPGDFSNILNSVSNAKKIFDLEEKSIEADVAVKKANEEFINAQTKNVDEDTKLKKYDKPLKLMGDVLEGLTPPPATLDVKGEILPNIKNNVDNAVRNTLNSAKSQSKAVLNQSFWHAVDWMSDMGAFLDNTVHGGNIPPKYFRGMSKSYRIKNGIYKKEQLFKK